MANLNTDLISPEQAIEATVAAYNSKAAISKIQDKGFSSLSSTATKIDASTEQNDMNIKLKYIHTKLATADKVAIVGDSISHGAFSTDIKNKSYVSLLKQSLTNRFNSKNYGFESVSASNTDGIWNSTMIHGMYTVGTWTTTEDANVWAINGSERWGVVNSTMYFEIDDLKEQTSFKINTLKSVSTACTYSVYVNNVLKEVFGSGATGNVIQNALSNSVALADNGSGGATIKIVITEGTIGIAGITYYNKEADYIVNNYSQSGRKAENINEYVVSYIMSTHKVVFWNMGHNDAGTSDLTKYNQVMNWVKSYATSNGTIVIFCDFFWTHSALNAAKLKMISTSSLLANQSIYIDIPTSLTLDNSIPKITYLTTTLGAWSDESHPNDKGHRAVFSQIKKALQL